jgi:5-methylcytosine-specific restriction endonuclease McrA
LAFNIHSDPKRDNQLPYTQEQYETFRLHVLTRDKYICQFCGEPATDVHHEIPVKLQPFHAVDPCYGWSCCEKCHYAKGHPKGTACSTGNLAAVVCKPIKRKNAP